MYKRTIVAFLVFVFAVAFASTADKAEAASKYDAALAKWSRYVEYSDKLGGRFRVRATYYSTEYVEALLESEAQKNMWTASELEDYKYNFLKGIRLDEYVTIHLELEELGPTAHMAPFNEMVSLWMGKTSYQPKEYDQRFNFPLSGKRDGLVFFPRFDEKTGKPLLQGVKNVRFIMKGGASPVLDGKQVSLIWDIGNDDPAGLVGSTAADRLELDRLIKRVEKLTGEKKDLEAQLSAKDKELDEVNARINELQKK